MIEKKRKSDRLIAYKERFPVETAYIVHTEMDLKMLSYEDNRNVVRSWSTVMIDAVSMGVLTKCVKHFSRLPDEIITDNGSEFQSI